MCSSFGPFSLQPAEGVLHVLDDGRQLDLRSQAIVDGDEGVTFRPGQLAQLARNGIAATHDEGPAMNPDQDGANLVVVGPVDIGLDFEIVDGLVGVGFLGEGGRFGRGTTGEGVQEGAEKQEGEEAEGRERVGHGMIPQGGRQSKVDEMGTLEQKGERLRGRLRLGRGLRARARLGPWTEAAQFPFLILLLLLILFLVLIFLLIFLPRGSGCQAR